MLSIVEYGWWIVGGLLVAGMPVWLFVILLRRVRHGSLGRVKAALTLLATTLLPIPYAAVITALHYLANLSRESASIWSGDAGMVAIGTIAVLLATVCVLNVVFWGVLLSSAASSTDRSSIT